MHESVLAFGRKELTEELVRGKHVLEVGSLNVNGSLRSHVEALGPASYWGIDIQEGPGVDEVLDCCQLGELGVRVLYDLIICTEMLEHAPDWRKAINEIKDALLPGGYLLLTTRSKGFPLHCYPEDHWRFSEEDMRQIFADFRAEVSPDPQTHGVFVMARKDHDWEITIRRMDLDTMSVHSMADEKETRTPETMWSVIHPSARPDKWQAVYIAWLEAAKTRAFEYILVCDRRWGFVALPEILGDPRFRAVWNTGRRCYVDAVNIGAQYATGQGLIVVADDQFPCEGWDIELAQVLGDTEKEVVEVTTGTPNEHDRGILVMPILTKARYERLGYVLYPEYESMYSDNDFCEMARRDDAIADARHLVFPHKHPLFDDSVKADAPYIAQNRPEAYQTGLEVLARRRQTNFGATWRKTINILLPGETFSSAWVAYALSMIQALNSKYNINVSMGHCSNVYVTRHGLANEAMSTKADYILWIDDDNLVGGPHVEQLIEDLDQIPEIDIVVGWCECHGDSYASPVIQSSVGHFGEKGKNLSIHPEELHNATALIKIDWTGFPLVLMRQSALAKMNKPFQPAPNEHSFYGFDSEDISFCRHAKELGLNIAVDPRVCVPHLKLRDSNVVSPARAAGNSKGDK